MRRHCRPLAGDKFDDDEPGLWFGFWFRTVGLRKLVIAAPTMQAIPNPAKLIRPHFGSLGISISLALNPPPTIATKRKMKPVMISIVGNDNAGISTCAPPARFTAQQRKRSDVTCLCGSPWEVETSRDHHVPPSLSASRPHDRFPQPGHTSVLRLPLEG